MTHEELVKLLDELAARFGIDGSHLWGVMIRHHFEDGVMGAATGAVMIGVGIGLARLTLHLRALYLKDSANNHGYSTNFMYEPAGIVSCILSGILLFIGLILITSSVTEIINPEYFAIRDVLGALGDKG